MAVLDQILAELDEMYIIDHVTKKHDVARNTYPRRDMTVSDDVEFDNMIADYYNYHFGRCISSGAELTRAESAGRAKVIIDKVYKTKGMDKLNAYFDGKNGTNGGMYRILDAIADSMKEDAVEHHIRDVIDRYVQPSSFDEQVEIVKEIFHKLGNSVPYIDYTRPGKYARNYEDLIRALVEHMKRQSMIFRKL